MRIASIDIGTNTVLLLVADVDENGTIYPVEHQQRIPRLGKDVDEKKTIHISAFDRIAWILNEYKNLSTQLKADHVVACATSAVRDSANKQKFLSYLKQTTGIDVEVLSGENEALWTYRGAASRSPELARRAIVIDIGGGSTEISFHGRFDHPLPPGEGGGEFTLLRHSFQVGSVRLTERFFKHDPPKPKEVENAKEFIRNEFSTLTDFDTSVSSLIGVAGTATTLACLDQGLKEFAVEKVSGYGMERKRVGEWIARLSESTTEQIRSMSDTTEGRADILTAGVLILWQFMTQFQIGKIIISERGLRYGLVVREWENQFKNQK